MTGKEGPDPPSIHLKDKLQVLIDTYSKVREINLPVFAPQVSSFGFVTYLLGALFLFILTVIILLQNAVADGVQWNDLFGGFSAQFVFSLGLYFVVYHGVEQIKSISEPSEEVQIPSRPKAMALTGAAIIGAAIVLRIQLVPGIDQSWFWGEFSSLKILSPLGVLAYSVSLDLFYIGLLLVGVGIFLEGAYWILNEPDNETKAQ